MKIVVIALGCPKNLVDTEVMLGFLDDAGHTFTDSPEEADLAIVTTCSFISAAVQESKSVVTDCLRLRDAGGPLRRVIAAGCLPQRYGRRTFDILPGVDGVVGCSGFHRMADVVESVAQGQTVFMVDEAVELFDETCPRILATPAHLAYVKIADGCDNRCAYCTIPSIRGRLRSRAPDSLIREVEDLARADVREVNLIAQDTTAYGTDIAPCYSLSELLVALSETGVPWMRLLYTHPAHTSEELLSCIAETEHVLPYLDMPIQHVSDRILQAMGRGVSGDRIRELVTLARDSIPEVTIRSSVIVGFPGETAAEFDELRSFLSEGGIDHLSVFEFSPEPGTRAFDFGPRVDDEVSSCRARELVALMEQLATESGRASAGLKTTVLIDRRTQETDGFAVAGRTSGQAWETDGEVLVECSGTAPSPGGFVTVTLTGARGFDLTARMDEGGVGDVHRETA